jgi:hypothetical protein
VQQSLLYDASSRFAEFGISPDTLPHSLAWKILLGDAIVSAVKKLSEARDYRALRFLVWVAVCVIPIIVSFLMATMFAVVKAR